MNKVSSFFKSFDVFGEQISLNYRGDSSYRTSVGAFFSIVMKSFILTLTVLGFIDVY